MNDQNTEAEWENAEMVSNGEITVAPEELPADADPEEFEIVTDLIAEHPLCRLFGDSVRVRLLAALLSADWPMNPQEIVSRADVGRRSWYEHRDALLATGLIVKQGDAGNSPLYRAVVPEEDVRAEWLAHLGDLTNYFENENHRIPASEFEASGPPRP